MHQTVTNTPLEPAIEQELTLSQQGLWFLMREGGPRLRAAYNMVFAFDVQGVVDEELLCRALAAVTKRHPALRSSLTARDGLALQAVDAVDMPFQPDLRRAVGNIALVAKQESGEPVNLHSSPTWHATMVHESADGPVSAILFVFSHLLFDEVSSRIFFADLAAAYSHGKSITLEGPTQSVNSTAKFERNHLTSPSGQAALEKIASQLEGLPERLALPRTNVSLPKDDVYELAGVKLVLTPEETACVAQAAGACRVSTAAWHLAAFQIVLWRYTRQEDFGISVPVSPRAALNNQSAIGYFTNLGVIRARVEGHVHVRAFLHTCMERLLDVLDDAVVPYPAVVKRLRRSGTQLQGTYLQVGFSHLRTEDAPLVVGKMHWKPIEVLPTYAKNELKLDVQEASGFTRLWFLYDASGFDATLVEQMGQDYRRLVLAMIDHPQSRICELPLLEEGMKQKLLHEWSGAMQRQEVQEECVHRSIEAQAALAPHALAMVGDFGELSYGELNVRANRLARRLRTLAVGTDVLVGVCAHGGPELVTAMLAVLKAGGAYVPLDPQYPPERLAYMVADAAVPVVLVAPGCGHGLPSTAVQLQVHADDDQEQSGANLDVPVSGGHLAYCIYTSGSTGQPKGAANTHRGFANLVRWYASECLVDAGVAARVLLASSPSFDLTQKNLLGTLAAAGTLVIPAGNARDVDALRQALHQHAPTVINCAPSAYRAYVDEPGTLRTVVLGGEPIDAALAEQVRAHGLRLVNSYGPTECADVAVRHLVADEAAEVPLGRPLANVQVYVLDERCQPVPIGVVGELHIAGAGISRGYVGRAALTAEKFIPDPFGSPGSRMYRTGDLARFRRDGLLEFLGRTDHQVKVRGYRIELGEVESALLRCAGVREAAVLAPADEHGQRSLAAYVSAAEGVGLEPGALRDALASMLPLHMVPTRWQVLPALPLNGSGKIDRLMLAQVHTAAPSGAAYEPPVGATEVLLAGLWADVLRVERVGRHDDFFALGGHSLSATQVVARVNQHLSLRSSVRQLFDASTVSAFARVLDALPVVPVDDSKSSQAIIARPRRAQIQSHGRLASGPPLIYKGRQHE